MRKRVFWSIFATAFVAVALIVALTLAVLGDMFGDELMASLKTQADYLAYALDETADKEAFLRAVAGGERITLIASDGGVLYDNVSSAAGMENHLDRPEIAAALENGQGESRRYSSTAMEQYLYYAKRLADGGVLRVSATKSSALGLLDGIFTPLFLTAVAVAVAAAVIARLLSRRLMAPIARVDFSAPLEGDVYDELSPMLLMMQHQNDALKEQNEKLEKKSRELTAVMENMREGMLLLNEKGEILAINKSAAKALGADAQSLVGASMVAARRDADMLAALNKALGGGIGEAEVELDTRAYSFIVNPVAADGAVLGAVALLLDVTDKKELEKSRREFTANVTHELKTPLTSIVGYAEIMRDGVARAEDTREFAGRIYTEGKRMIQLVEDILKLSQLDERQRLPKSEHVELKALCQSVIERLRDKAAEAKVTLALTGGEVTVYGMKKLLDEMIFNLVDNAIKYNVPGGSVEVALSEDGGARLCVSDTGIGIPKEHQAHVFERFYRVDKSHSKATGGTGLGLSIVKHGAMIHSARLELESMEGEGTAITLIFPEK